MAGMSAKQATITKSHASLTQKLPRSGFVQPRLCDAGAREYLRAATLVECLANALDIERSGACFEQVGSKSYGVAFPRNENTLGLRSSSYLPPYGSPEAIQVDPFSRAQRPGAVKWTGVTLRLNRKSSISYTHTAKASEGLGVLATQLQRQGSLRGYLSFVSIPHCALGLLPSALARNGNLFDHLDKCSEPTIVYLVKRTLLRTSVLSTENSLAICRFNSL